MEILSTEERLQKLEKLINDLHGTLMTYNDKYCTLRGEALIVKFLDDFYELIENYFNE